MKVLILIVGFALGIYIASQGYHTQALERVNNKWVKCEVVH